MLPNSLGHSWGVRGVGLHFLVIGQGSIGQRHSRLLAENGAVDCVSAEAPDAYRSIREALGAHVYSHAVIANPTSRHYNSVEELAGAGFSGHLLVEKPLCANLAQAARIQARSDIFASVVVGYNLRFSPALIGLRAAMVGSTVIEARLSVGQSLLDWRPGSDYRMSSSARILSGGGVLRDLSHELDLALLLFGPWKRVVALGGNYDRLGIETDEAWSIILEMQNGPVVSISMNYFDRPPQRSITLTTTRDTLAADLIAGTVSRNGGLETFPAARDETYKALHHDFINRREMACSLSDGIEVVRLIHAIERSVGEKKWVEA